MQEDIEKLRKIIGRFLETRRSYGVAHLNDEEADFLENTINKIIKENNIG